VAEAPVLASSVIGRRHLKAGPWKTRAQDARGSTQRDRDDLEAVLILRPYGHMTSLFLPCSPEGLQLEERG
jgi:hypothetical protein